MEDYIEKLFKQYPFIYKIGDRFLLLELVFVQNV